EAALATGHIAILEYRRKKVAKPDQEAEVERIKALAEKYRTPFVINDDLALAEKLGLGVHLGQSDGDISDAGVRSPHGAIIGCSCNETIQDSEIAIVDGGTDVASGEI